MKVHRATYVTLIILFICAISYFISASSLSSSKNNLESVGPGYFPKLLAVLLVILCIIEFVKTLRGNKKGVIKMENISVIFIVIGATIVYLVSWYFLNFYISTFIFLISLLIVLRPKKKMIVPYIVLTLIYSVFIYLAFDLILNVKL